MPSVAEMLKETLPATAGESARTWKLMEFPASTEIEAGVTATPVGTEAATTVTITDPWKLPMELTVTPTLESELVLMLTPVWKVGTDNENAPGPTTKNTVIDGWAVEQDGGGEANTVTPKMEVAAAPAAIFTVRSPKTGGKSCGLAATALAVTPVGRPPEVVRINPC